MHLLIIGGSGRTGKAIVSEALSKGHTLTALVRSSSSLTPSTGLIIVQGQLTAPDITEAIASSPVPPTAVIVALASLRKTDSPFSAPVSPPTMMTDAHTALIAAMKIHGIERIITVSAFGVRNSWENLFLPMRLVIGHSGVGYGFKDHEKVEGVLRQSGLDWTAVKPAMLSDGEKKEVRVWGEQGKGIGMLPKVSRKSVAGFLVECMESDEWVGKTPVIAE